MSLSRNALNAIIAGAFAVSLAGAGHTAFAADNGMSSMEKCYGVVKAGHNDCADMAKTHSCQGQAILDGSGGDFIALPKGVCEKLAGSALQPTSKQGTKPTNG